MSFSLHLSSVCFYIFDFSRTTEPNQTWNKSSLGGGESSLLQRIIGWCHLKIFSRFTGPKQMKCSRYSGDYYLHVSKCLSRKPVDLYSSLQCDICLVGLYYAKDLNWILSGRTDTRWRLMVADRQGMLTPRYLILPLTCPGICACPALEFVFLKGVTSWSIFVISTF